MAEKYIVAGGFASTAHEVADVAAKLQDRTGLPHRGVNLMSALCNRAEFAEKIDGQHVVSHSAGAFAASRATELGARPLSATLIAPPIPERLRNLIWRGLLIGIDDPAAREEIEAKVVSQSSVAEIARHPLRSARVVQQLARFSSFAYALELQQSGVPTTIGFMEQDGLFNLLNVDEVTLEALRSSGVAVKQIRGAHTRFTASPVATLAELAEAPELIRPIKTLNPSLSARRFAATRWEPIAARWRPATQ